MSADTKNINDLEVQSKILETKWSKELDLNGVTEKSKKLHADLLAFNKKHFPVMVSLLEHSDHFSKEKEKECWGEIDFSQISGWADRKVFHTVTAGQYQPNEAGRAVKIQFSRGGGSAFLNFEPDLLSAVRVIATLKAHNYKTVVNDLLAVQFKANQDDLVKRLGALASQEERKRVPAHDPLFMALLEKCGLASRFSTDLMKTWLDSFDQTNLQQPMPNVDNTIHAGVKPVGQKTRRPKHTFNF